MQVPVKVMNETQCLEMNAVFNPKIQVCGGEKGKMVCSVIIELLINC
jgi:hypothetical protein